MRWARAHATALLVLPEQLDPFEGTALSVAPLTWVGRLGYLEALQRLR